MTANYNIDGSPPGDGRFFTITVSSGKGGVGKTTVSLNIAIALAQRKRRVVLLDGDLGLGNINVMLGVRPVKDLSHVIDGKCSLEEALIKGPWGISILPAGTGYEDMADLEHEARARLLATLHDLRRLADILIIDTGAGIGTNVLSFAMAADVILVVVTPDVASITDAYSLVKLISQRPGFGRLEMLINRAPSREAGEEVTVKMRGVVKKFLSRDIAGLGIVPEDQSVQQALSMRKPLLLSHPKCPASMVLRSIADKLIAELRQMELQFKPPQLDARLEKIISRIDAGEQGEDGLPGAVNGGEAG
ncbi:MAG: MinD/ParA family protein [Nitrospinae bacterium]|nr:MinD/ParA family protein [Nitrospinota bacterium]MBF0634872.1 MinD/ParA family protein [Nitrospinota bacterium]